MFDQQSRQVSWFTRNGRAQLKIEGVVMGMASGLFAIALVYLHDFAPKQSSLAMIRLSSYGALAAMVGIAYFVHTMFLVKHPYYPM